jgi:hypothetical protein
MAYNTYDTTYSSILYEVRSNGTKRYTFIADRFLVWAATELPGDCLRMLGIVRMAMAQKLAEACNVASSLLMYGFYEGKTDVLINIRC